ncbi:hypothetical protein ACH3XW_27620 [Acanthocheilonema viteae]
MRFSSRQLFTLFQSEVKILYTVKWQNILKENSKKNFTTSHNGYRTKSKVRKIRIMKQMLACCVTKVFHEIPDSICICSGSQEA